LEFITFLVALRGLSPARNEPDFECALECVLPVNQTPSAVFDPMKIHARKIERFFSL